MRNLLFFILALCLSTSAFAQENPNCDFLKNLKFKNGTDTIVVKATYVTLEELFSNTVFYNKLRQQFKLKKNTFSDQVTIKPINCEVKYLVPDASNDAAPLKLSNIGKSLYFTMVVFERKDWYNNNTPFYMITKIRTEK